MTLKERIVEYIGFDPYSEFEVLKELQRVISSEFYSKIMKVIQAINITSPEIVKILKEVSLDNPWTSSYIKSLLSIEDEKEIIEASGFDIGIIATSSIWDELLNWMDGRTGKNTHDRVKKYAGWDPLNVEERKIRIKEKPYSIDFVPKAGKELQELAIKENYYSIQIIKNPSLEMQKMAIERSDFDIYTIAMCPNWRELEDWLEDNLLIKELLA